MNNNHKSLSLSTHVLNSAIGRPAGGIAITLERYTGECVDDISAAAADQWRKLSNGITNDDGRITTLIPHGEACGVGIYRLTFQTKKYFKLLGMECFYPNVQVLFEVQDLSMHYHVPLLVSPYSYSTYRGS